MLKVKGWALKFIVNPRSIKLYEKNQTRENLENPTVGKSREF